MIGINLTGADGSSWDLRSGPVRMISAAAEGFGHPKFTRPTRSTPGRAGQRRTNRKSTTAAREGYLPVELWADDEAGYFDLSERWWRAWDPDRPGTLRATRPDGTWREIDVFLSEDDYAPETDPSVEFGEAVSVTWIADQPWWRGPRVTRAFGVADGAGDFLNGGKAPPFVISSSNVSGSGTLANPGDEPAFPTYRIAGGATRYGVTIGGATVSGIVAVPAGSTLTIDSAAQVALLAATDGSVQNITPRLSSIDFRPIAPGEAVPISTFLSGPLGATLAVEFSPLYRRAW